MKSAHFSVAKELADFDFSAIPSLNKAQVLDLARGEYIRKHESIVLIGNPGLGKSHLATALAHTACRQGRRVRFWTAASLVNDLIEAQDDHRLHRLIASAVKLSAGVVKYLKQEPFYLC
jgi:DNA replication protein DnaC